MIVCEQGGLRGGRPRLLDRLPCGLWRLHCCLLWLCLPCRACIAARCFCVTAGQSATSNAIALEVASRRRICLAFPHPAAHGLLSLFRLLRAFLLNAIKRNQAPFNIIVGALSHEAVLREFVKYNELVAIHARFCVVPRIIASPYKIAHSQTFLVVNLSTFSQIL